MGTLNLKMGEEASSNFQSFTKTRKGILIKPADEKSCVGKCFRVRVKDGISGALVVPLVPNYPRDQVEVIAPVNLRRVLGLEDGDEVTVEIFDS